ncbi:PEP-CTERM sorting domain-containing protein [Pseudorhodoferax sp. Leaf267]|uniref:PEP-CTERM sorting domain-containing protein n=1 Tax=Pseudorhodoferax sp. Leaf267 TaxID=1736316 RepID=UPI0006F66BB7|nr:PEP-CTERM sorting domain-containing protein [Pseudorhodoferax sp. Leaf267]KQP12659.1 hypothetical protein ASF43_20705 [Pseudorhodoferax sp. Leaf267]
MKRSVIYKAAVAGLLWACASVGQAALVTQTLPDYSSSDAVWKESLVLNVGTFDFSNVGNIVSATLRGTFGNAFSNTSTESRILADGIEAASCSVWDNCYSLSELDEPEAFSYTFSVADLALLSDGLLAISIDKTYEGYVNLGGLTLELDIAEVPEPASAALMLAGLAGLGWSLRRRRPQA